MGRGDSSMTAVSAEAPKYTRAAVALHWLVAIMILGMIALGLYLRFFVPRDTPPRTWWTNLHKSLGIIVACFIFARLAWRLRHRPPPLPRTVPQWQVIGARWSHTLLYVCMVVQPVSGYVASNFSKWGIKFFNHWHLPPWGWESHTIYTILNDIHIVNGWLLLALIAIHVAAALMHAGMRDRVFERMLPS